MIKVGGRDFIPLKCAGSYVGGYSMEWMQRYFEQMYEGPPRVHLSANRTGWYRDDLDRWLRKRSRAKRKSSRAA